MRIAIAGGTGTVGRHIVHAVAEAGHEPVVLARSTGTDLVTGAGLDDALTGCEAVIDASGVQTLSAKRALQFFTPATTNLLKAGKAAGVTHHVTLSIVGAITSPHGYYAGKAAQEQLVMDSDRPWSILRATQFHEFAPQTVERGAVLGLNMVPKIRSQPVAAAEVATELVGIATGEPRGIAQDLAGPREENVADMVRRYLRAVGRRPRVVEFSMPGAMGAAMARGDILPDQSAHLGRQTFEEWLGEVASRTR